MRTFVIQENDEIRILGMSAEKGETYSMEVIGDGSGRYESRDHISFFLKGEQLITWNGDTDKLIHAHAPTFGGSTILEPENKWVYPEGVVEYHALKDCLNVFIYPSKACKGEGIEYDYSVVESGEAIISSVPAWVIPLEGSEELTLNPIPANAQAVSKTLSLLVWETNRSQAAF